MKFFLGIDIGGSKSHALVADETGRVMGFGQAGCGNWEAIGYDGLGNVLRAITQQALTGAGISIEQLGGAGFGIAGYDWPSQYRPHMEAIQSLRLACPIGLVNDTLIGLLAGAEEGWGIAVVAGTGCNCWGLDRQGRVGRVTGEGELFGEEGGAGSLIRRAIQAISRQWSQRGPATRLTPAFLESKGVPDVLSFLEGLSLKRIALDAEDVRTVFKVADEGDRVAQAIVDWAGEQLADLACGVIHQLGLEGEAFEIVLVGSLWKSGPRLSESLRREVQKTASRARLMQLSAPPVVGGVVLGMQQAGVRNPMPRKELLDSFSRLRVI
jgi:N-acetylglucosamine kinase-like BadF-type ATPase